MKIMASSNMRILLMIALATTLTMMYSLSLSFPNLSRNMRPLMMAKGFGALKKPAFKYTGTVVPGILGLPLDVPQAIERPNYALDGIPKDKARGLPWEVTPQTADDIVKMRVSGKIAREVLDAAVRFVKVGVTTQEIDALVHEETTKRNSYPSPLNYHGFPKSCCTSINEIICHGIPDSTIVKDGDIINIDVTIFHDGVHGDCSETVLIGNVSPEVKDLVITTYQAWQAAIAICKPGVKYSEIGGVIEDIIVPKGYTSVKEFCGHGPVPVAWPDDWTQATADGKPSAQFEHTLLITETGVEALTGKLPTSPKYSWEV